MIMIKLLKYIFCSYFIILIYGMIKGREGLKDNTTLIEEYVFIVCLFVCLDVVLWIFKKIKEKNRLAHTQAKTK